MERFNELIREMTRANMAEMALCGVAGVRRNMLSQCLHLRAPRLLLMGI